MISSRLRGEKHSFDSIDANVCSLFLSSVDLGKYFIACSRCWHRRCRRRCRRRCTARATTLRHRRFSPISGSVQPRQTAMQVLPPAAAPKGPALDQRAEPPGAEERRPSAVRAGGWTAHAGGPPRGTDAVSGKGLFLSIFPFSAQHAIIKAGRVGGGGGGNPLVLCLRDT